MADSAASVWGVAVTGVFTLFGVGLGGFLTHVTTTKINEQQSKEARKVRKIEQLQRLDASLDLLSTQFGAVVGQVTGIIAFKHPADFKSIPDAKLSDIQFLIRVYLPEAVAIFKELKLDYGQGISKAFEAIADKSHGDDAAASRSLTLAIEKQASFVERVQKMQEQIAYRAQEIEFE